MTTVVDPNEKGLLVTLFDLIDASRKRWDVLGHPFYVQWSAGELTREDLATYAGQYRHATVALAAASRAGAASAVDLFARAMLEAHAREEAEHVGLWDQFSAAVGADREVAATAETQQCVDAWRGERSERDLVASLAVLYAVESSQPRIAQVKRSGLVEHYGFRAESPATEYFDVHAVRDYLHAGQHRSLLQSRLTGADIDRLAEGAEDALAANWALLDGVDRLRASGAQKRGGPPTTEPVHRD